jgi:phenylpropionate dioxygenase-like ring-hydroxylating dioxygenase large terminal subunit
MQDRLSRITVFPDGTDRCTVHHDLLVPADTDLDASYWDKTFALINERVFAAEDIAVCESIQSAARSRADRKVGRPPWPLNPAANG